MKGSRTPRNSGRPDIPGGFRKIVVDGRRYGWRTVNQVRPFYREGHDNFVLHVTSGRKDRGVLRATMRNFGRYNPLLPSDVEDIIRRRFVLGRDVDAGVLQEEDISSPARLVQRKERDELRTVGRVMTS